MTNKVLTLSRSDKVSALFVDDEQGSNFVTA